MKTVRLFLEEVTEELLYNIVHDNKLITYFTLRSKFKRKTGYQPMEFFGLGNETNCTLPEFLKKIPGLKTGFANVRTTRDDSDFTSENSSDEDGDTKGVYEIFNTTYLKDNGMFVSEYREELLIECCEIMKDDFADVSSCQDANGNTPLHLLAALPGVNYDCNTLLTYLLKAGVNPVAENEDGQTFLHIIFGRYRPRFICTGTVFTNERTNFPKWFLEDRMALLKLVSEKFSQLGITSLVKAQDNYGDTLLHECVSSRNVEKKLIEKLLKLGANVRLPNNNGEVPLHFTSNPSIFKILVKTEPALCRVRNDRDETPVLFNLKMSVNAVFAQTSASKELADQCSVDIKRDRNVTDAMEILENLTSILAENKLANETVWIPDVEGNIAIDVVLIAIRIASYSFSTTLQRRNELQSALVNLLDEMLFNANASDMQRQNKKGQSFLHVLLDMGDDCEHEISRTKHMCLCVQILLDCHIDVNATDSIGRTALDIVHKHLKKGLTLYQKFEKLLTENGAISLTQEMQNLRINDETRKLRMCPKRHLKKAEYLTDPDSDVSVVGKYRYSMQDPIGSGAFSTIFVAIKDENVSSSGNIECRAYALKRLEKAKINPQEIQREITTLLSISGKCENIIKYHESDEDDFFRFIVLDLMDGDLDEFLENDSVSKVPRDDPIILVQVIKQIVNGLAFLHENNLIHRDLKPGNILYTTDSSLHFKIADFGLTKNTSTSSSMTSTKGSGVAGTRCWMAPELVSLKTREHTQKSDIFSLGLVLHYLVTQGKHPFTKRKGERTHVIERKIEEMQMHLDTTLHPEAISFFQVLLAKDPLRRPPANSLNQHPFLWSEGKKIEFLKAVGDQREAEKPAEYRNSELEQCLQKTPIGIKVGQKSWNEAVEDLFEEMTKAWKQKNYRTDKVIDLIRFIRNAYAHRQERSAECQENLENNIFLRKYPSLVLDTFGVVQKLDFDEKRNNIRQALIL